jgi:hypothetical protein
MVAVQQPGAEAGMWNLDRRFMAESRESRIREQLFLILADIAF